MVNWNLPIDLYKRCFAKAIKLLGQLNVRIGFLLVYWISKLFDLELDSDAIFRPYWMC